MRIWARVTSAMLCGRCGDLMPSGAPVQIVQPWKLRRCAQCAQGEVPPDLPFGGVPQRTTRRMQPLRRVASSVLADFRARQAGD